MIATAALAGRLLAEADFSSSDRRKMAGGVLDDSGDCNARRPHLLAKAGLRSERALAAQGQRHYLIRCARNEILSFKF